MKLKRRPFPKNRLLNRPQTDQVIADEDVFEITAARGGQFEFA